MSWEGNTRWCCHDKDSAQLSAGNESASGPRSIDAVGSLHGRTGLAVFVLACTRNQEQLATADSHRA